MIFPLVVRFLRSNVLKSIKQVRKAIAASFVVLLIKVLFAKLIKNVMEKEASSSWSFWPYSREAARGALTCPDFQKMPNLLDRDPFGLVVLKAE